MASNLPAAALSPKPESSETTPYESSSLVEERVRGTPSIEEKRSPPDQDANSFRNTSPQTLKESDDVERGRLPALNNAVSRATTISKKRAYTFMILIVLTQAVQMFAYGAGIVGAYTVGKHLGASDLKSTWIAASYPLTQGSFVLISGRLGTVFGHKRIMTRGASIWIFCTLDTAYGTNIVGVSFMRGLAGIGGGLLVPNAVALLTITFPPGRQRSLALALFASMGPVSGARGCVFNDFFLHQAPIIGWKNPYEHILLMVAIGHFAVFLI
ncbi:major facilitator superfamily domain-containing protein [Trichoderma novae-zelandiae]